MENIENTSAPEQDSFTGPTKEDAPAFDPTAAEQRRAEAIAQHEATHPDLVKDPARAEIMAYASKKNIEEAQDLRDEVKNKLLDLEKPISQEYNTQYVTANAKHEIEEKLKLADQHAEEAAERYDAAKELDNVFDRELGDHSSLPDNVIE